MAAKKMILIFQEKYDRLMKQGPETPPIENAEKLLETIPKPVGRKRKAPSSIGTKRKAPPPPPGEPASKLAKRVLKFKRY